MKQINPSFVKSSFDYFRNYLSNFIVYKIIRQISSCLLHVNNYAIISCKCIQQVEKTFKIPIQALAQPMISSNQLRSGDLMRQMKTNAVLQFSSYFLTQIDVSTKEFLSTEVLIYLMVCQQIYITQNNNYLSKEFQCWLLMNLDLLTPKERLNKGWYQLRF
ncbi:hypothetical protein pb186bvf_020198 [Paramecium bursaria]